ncbi:hypothetical protein LTR85_003644 [Meristemomyces frigidus]|nr:hypothetical protein LTR85_003644 [Meristemomyces frigidus]
MSAALDAIGLISGVLGIVSFFQTGFPTSTPEGTTVQIKAGLGDSSSSGMGGKISAVYAFDDQNDYLGNSGSAKMGAGDYATVTVAQSNPGRQGSYISLSNTNDAVCIAWVTVTQNDGTASGAWTGDIGYNCGQHWYYGNQNAGSLPDGDNYVPLCTWLDGDATNGIPSAAMKFTTLAYGSQVQDTLDNAEICSATIFSADTGPISDQPAGTTTETTKKRATPVRYAWMEQQLVMSNHTSQTAAWLCGSATSYGPDFVGSDGQFCDMGSKTVSPLCSTSSENGCVVVSNSTVTRRWSVAKRAVQQVHKTYSTVDLWGA